MKKVRIYECGEWRYLLETSDDAVVVWPYFKGAALALPVEWEGAKNNIAFRRVFSGLAASKREKDTVRTYCDDFAQDDDFRAQEISAFERVLKENG